MSTRFIKRSLRQFSCKSKSQKSPSSRLADGRLTELGAAIEAQRCLLCVDAPCAKACPAGTQPDKFLRQLHFDNPLGAAQTVLDSNPLGGVCGTVCPVSKLCEGACTRKDIDGPVKIGAIQRYLHDFGVAQKISLPPVPEGTGHKTAVIGAGPAGLAAARELARRGSKVTVYERRPQAGGALRYALSPLRVDHAIVDEEVGRIAAMGVEFVFNSSVRDVADVMSKGYDAVFISPGLQNNRKVNVGQLDDYWKTHGMSGALTFLDSANTLKAEKAIEMAKDKHVVIIGGGSVAMDCAITAKSLGALSIHIVSREKISDLPADIEEVEFARQAGAVFHPEAEVTQIQGKTLSLKSFAINSNDQEVTKFQATLEASSIIVAAGQVLDEEGKELIKGNPKEGTIRFMSQTNTTGYPFRYYAGGDAVRGGGDTVVQAIADGKHAAAEILPNVSVAPRKRVSLATDFVGLTWENPFTLSSSPVTNSAEMIARAYDAGFSGAYYKTLNREDKFAISHPSPRLGVVHSGTHKNGGMGVGIQNMEQISDRPLEDNLKDIAWLRKNYPTKVTAVSIMGYCNEDWEYLAKAAEGSGAHLLELNFSCPQMARSDAGHHVGQQFGLIEQYTSVVKRAVNIPVVAKLTPNITDMIPAALAAQAGGADAVSAINTVKSISHIDLDSLKAMPTIQGYSAISGFSGRGMRPIGLRFVSELSRDVRLKIPISGMGGIYTWKDCAEYLAVGASNLQVTTSVMQHGNRVVEDMIDGLQHYLERNSFNSVKDVIGRANASIKIPSQLDTATEVVSVIDENLCIGCGVCEVACRDGAAAAISMHVSKSSCATNPKKAHVDRNACVGCKLCQFVCPVGAISFEVRPRIERPRFSK